MDDFWRLLLTTMGFMFGKWEGLRQNSFEIIHEEVRDVEVLSHHR